MYICHIVNFELTRWVKFKIYNKTYLWKDYFNCFEIKRTENFHVLKPMRISVRIPVYPQSIFSLLYEDGLELMLTCQRLFNETTTPRSSVTACVERSTKIYKRERINRNITANSCSHTVSSLMTAWIDSRWTILVHVYAYIKIKIQ